VDGGGRAAWGGGRGVGPAWGAHTAREGGVSSGGGEPPPTPGDHRQPPAGLAGGEHADAGDGKPADRVKQEVVGRGQHHECGRGGGEPGQVAPSAARRHDERGGTPRSPGGGQTWRCGGKGRPGWGRRVGGPRREWRG